MNDKQVITMDNFITRPEHEEYCRRVDAEEKRQNRRLELLEDNVQKIAALTVSIEKMACSLEVMAKELGDQGSRLQALEEVPGKNWSALRAGIIGAVAAAVGCGLAAAIVNFM